MEIYDKNDQIIENPDFDKGYIIPDKRLVAHHEAVEAVKEVGHYETVAEYPNGGKDVAWVVDAPGAAPREAWDEYEDIYRYIPYTPEDLEQIESKRTYEKRISDLETSIAYMAEALNMILTKAVV